jgi:glycosyltransferase involved in cell wall biosynthesis
MRVAHVVAELGTGGAEAVVEQLAIGQHAAGDHVVVASAGGRREATLTAAGVHTLRVPLYGRSANVVARASLALARLHRRLVVDPAQRVDVLHAHNIKATAAVHVGLRRLRRHPPLVTTFHGVAAQDYPSAARVLRFSADHVVVVAASVRDRLVAAGMPAERVSVIPNAVALRAELPVGSRERTRESLSIDADAPVAICAARLVPQKRQDVLLDAWSRLPQPLRSTAVLLLAGQGEDEGALRRQAHRLGLPVDAPGPGVRFLGDRSDVPALLGSADVVTLASDWEGLPIVVLEAMAASLPLVCTAVDGIVEAVDGEVPAGLLVPPRDPAALADALARVLGDPQLARELGAEGRRRATTVYAPESQVRSHATLYAALTSGATAHG